MSKVQDTSREVRDLLHDSSITKTEVFLKGSKGFWDQLWASLDVVDDTELAIEEFKNLSVEQFKCAPYIATYGLLQALYVQQDAVSHLKESLFGERIKWDDQHPSVSFVRNVRNESIGHPSKQDRNPERVRKHCVIDRSSLTPDGFSYSVWSSGNFERKSIGFSDLIAKQGQALQKELSIIKKRIMSKEDEHKKKFSGTPLSPMLPARDSHIYAVLRKLAFDELGKVMFVKKKEDYEKIKKELEKRYGPLNKSIQITGTRGLVEELDRIFLRIDELRNSEENVDIDLGIYADALVKRLQELKEHLDEVDEEFSSSAT